ncbi:MAG: FHA domain-containing protein [Anaerolineae bacterium]|jgi:hypothetical protein|nr:FHA domain-containing protein [Anaerolineae bacterium]
MPVDVLLFGLRVISGLLLLAVLAALMLILWRDFRSATSAARVSRRAYGQLIKLTLMGEMMAETGETFALTPMTTLGRAPTNQIVLNDTFASSEHAVVLLRHGQWWLEDRNSRNGTLLNGERITLPVIITEGDIIGIGSVGFRLLLSPA